MIRRALKLAALAVVARRVFLAGYRAGVHDEERREDALVNRRAADALATAKAMIAEAHEVMGEAEQLAAVVLRDLAGALGPDAVARITDLLPGVAPVPHPDPIWAS